jgi:hypothetical protein
VLEVERLVTVADIVSDGAFETELGIDDVADDVADDMAGLDVLGVAPSQTLRNMVPKPVPTESVAL